MKKAKALRIVLQAQYDKAMSHKQMLVEDAETCRRKMTNAMALIEGLGGEKVEFIVFSYWKKRPANRTHPSKLFLLLVLVADFFIFVVTYFVKSWGGGGSLHLRTQNCGRFASFLFSDVLIFIKAIKLLNNV